MLNSSEENSIRSVSEYLSYLEDTSDNKKQLFRGQNTDKPLDPKIVRLITEKDKSLKYMREIENKMLSRFRKESVPMLRKMQQPTDLDLLSIAQHYGMPTRLLDWTANSLVALWFAVLSKPPKKDDRGVVWMLKSPNEKIFKPFDEIFKLDKTYFFQPPHLDRRISSQSAWLSIHRYASRGKKDWYLPLEEHERYKGKWTKFTIPLEYFDSLRQELRLLGVNHASIFPDLSGLSSDIKDEFFPY